MSPYARTVRTYSFQTITPLYCCIPLTKEIIFTCLVQAHFPNVFGLHYVFGHTKRL
ncbi:hypothetical protein crov003 [Cafeteria roenbergensis virus]|uniref:Uncharacterized protein n=1 Tax=Cafeteria roenbergensis virus (strain BV-PW1) TaxID=693272 RepID=E3T4C3_CROVB|nr:hypothetical protein crov003 [Cafeteria roenbergensis virus BV-PW1]ADO67036.1 hypothetical protein crov003 [Cafeteria roenbergensis virus BV-PW1]